MSTYWIFFKKNKIKRQKKIGIKNKATASKLKRSTSSIGSKTNSGQQKTHDPGPKTKLPIMGFFDCRRIVHD